MGLFRLFFILALLIPLTAPAVIVNRVTEFEAHTKATADDLNDEFDNIISAINGNLGPENFLVGSIASGNIVNGAITTDKIATGAVTNAKLAAANIVNSDAVTFSTYNDSFVEVPSLSGTITTSGRPVLVRLSQGDEFPFVSEGSIKTYGGTSSENSVLIIKNGVQAYNSPIGDEQNVPCGIISFIDEPVASSNQYAVVVSSSFGGTIEVQNCKIQLMEF